MLDKRINIFKLLEQENRLSKVLVYPAQEVENDPTERTRDENLLNPITIKALIQQISFESLKWKYYGQIPQDSIQIICELKYENLLKLANKIQIGDNYYKCFKDDNGFKILKRNDYLICILEKKNV